MTNETPDILLIFSQQLGLLSLVAVVLAVARRNAAHIGHPLQQLLAGIALGIGAIVAMLQPVVLQPGVIFDIRSVPIAVSAPFGGPIATLVAAALAAGYRWSIGGAGVVVATLSIVLVAGVSLAFAFVLRRGDRSFGIRHLMPLALCATIASFVPFVLAPAVLAERAFQELLIPLFAVNVLGVGLVGVVLIDERRRRELQRRLSASLDQQRAQAEQLRSSEAEYRLLAESTTDMIVRVDTSARRLYVSPGCVDILGYTQQELLGTTPHDFVHPDEAELVRTTLGRLIAGEAEQALSTHRFRRKDGGYVWVEAKLKLVRDENGAPKEVVSVVRDVSDRQRQAEELKAAKEEAERVAESLRLRDRSLEAIEQGVIIVDAQVPTLPMIYVNPAFERLTGYSEEEVLGRNCRFLQGEETDRAAIARVSRALRTGRPITETVVNYRKDGTSFINELVISPVRDLHGAVSHFVGIQSDVTRRIEMEAQLRQSQKMEALGHLTGGVAHDFNNLLTVILGNADLLAEQIDDRGLLSLAEQVRAAAERGSDLTQKLLAFGRRQSLRPEQLDVTQVVLDMAPLLRRTIGEHIEFKLEGEGTAFALADRTLLENALLNLVVNARDAMPQGGTLTIATGERLSDSNEGTLPVGRPVAYLTVSDTGTGMPPEVMARAFEPFFTTKEVGKGSGLGLSMVYGFAQQSGGHVSITSREGEGTSVSIVLRTVETPAAQVAPLSEERPIVLQGRERILVVEDDATVLQYVSSQLISLGYDVTAVGNATDALSLLDEDPIFDLLLTDVVLPGPVNGVELAKRASAKRPHMKVLLTSGYPEEVFEQHGRPDPGTRLLRKPYKRKELAKVLRQALSDEPVGAALLGAA